MVDTREGRVLWARNPDQVMFPASLTKIMTGALAVESGDLNRICTISERAARVPETGLGLEAGERVRLSDLLRGALIWSANDASVAIAEAVAGDVDSFVQLMNRRAREWGATHTVFRNPHGLHDDGHYSTARDLATITLHAMQQPSFREIVAMHRFRMARPVRVASPDSNSKTPPGTAPVKLVTYQQRVFSNRNRLLLSWGPCDGVKTGYTRQAGNCLVASAAPTGWHALAVVLKSTNAWQDARSLLEWAAATYELRTLAAPDSQGWTLPVRDGQTKYVPVAPSRPLSILTRVDAPSPPMMARGGPAQAPVRRGDKLGFLEVVEGSRVRARVELVAQSDVALSTWGQIKQFALPDEVSQGLLCVAAGVLLLGTAAKAARTCRYRLAACRRAADPGRTGHR